MRRGIRKQERSSAPVSLSALLKVAFDHTLYISEGKNLRKIYKYGMLIENNARNITPQNYKSRTLFHTERTLYEQIYTFITPRGR